MTQPSLQAILRRWFPRALEPQYDGAAEEVGAWAAGIKRKLAEPVEAAPEPAGEPIVREASGEPKGPKARREGASGK